MLAMYPNSEPSLHFFNSESNCPLIPIADAWDAGLQFSLLKCRIEIHDHVI